jgi:hypothetical protein
MDRCEGLGGGETGGLCGHTPKVLNSAGRYGIQPHDVS